MSPESLRARVKDVHETLERGEPLTPEQRARLDAVLEEVEGRLEAERPDSDEEDSLVERVREAGLQFEESHPNLTAAVGAVADALARLGI